jgi:hypothetical protein
MLVGPGHRVHVAQALANRPSEECRQRGARSVRGHWAVFGGDLAEARGHRGAADPGKMKLVQRPPIPLEVACGVDIGSQADPAFLARQKAANDGAERFIGCVHAGFRSLGGWIAAKPDLGEKISRRLPRLRWIEDLGRADGHAALAAAERVLHDKGARAAGSQSQAKAGHVVIEDDRFALVRR